MTPRTIWRARRAGDRILCGRQVPPGSGVYVCQGEIAVMHEAWHAKPKVRLPAGLAVGHPLEPDDVAHWHETARARSQRGRGQKAAGHGTVGESSTVAGHQARVPAWAVKTRHAPMWSAAAMPFTRDCPHCKCTARVDSAVLESPQ